MVPPGFHRPPQEPGEDPGQADGGRRSTPGELARPGERRAADRPAEGGGGEDGTGQGQAQSGAGSVPGQARKRQKIVG